ncbi:hypothetical protein SLEP1_g35452 [Rubroshorea leprosula]|uniref:Uncharacterized protein n=1 Tax=Rubroshorea leprosula TaxID=152421 RepID=A0AAV5KNI0_9ROSI|nr:hypothetical protein SLEP1_g35452 [Rubroshorea leprosula]
MSRNPAASARRRSSSSGSQGERNRDQPQVFSSSGIAHDTEGPSCSKGKKGRGRNLKGLRPPENRESRTWVKLTDDKLQFADPSIPRAITALWKSRFDGPHFTFDRVPNNKINEIYACFKAWVKAIGGCSSSFMPGIGSQVNPEDVGFSYRKRPPRDNLMPTMMMFDFVEEQAHHIEGSGLRMNTPVTYSTDSTQTSPIVPEHQQQQQQLPPQDDVYCPVFDPDYLAP